MADLVMDIDIGIIMDILKTGNSVELPASGDSMFPTLRSGDIITVKPFFKGELPMKGNVVVYNENGILVMHRLTEIISDINGMLQYITRGDSRMEPDKPWPHQQLLGKAIGFKRCKKEYSIKPITPGVLRYLFNHRLFWFYNKIKRITRVMRNLNAAESN